MCHVWTSRLSLFKDVAQEKVQQDFLNGVKNFKRHSLKRINTEEKFTLPTSNGENLICKTNNNMLSCFNLALITCGTSNNN